MRIEEKELQGRNGPVTYKCNSIPGRQGARILLRIVKLVGPGFGALAELIGTSDGAPNLADVMGRMASGALERAARALVENIDDPKTETLAFDILTHAHVTRIDPDTHKFQDVARPEVFDEVYCENYFEAGRALYFALETSYADFFGAAGPIGRVVERVRELGTTKPPPSPSSRPTSPRGSTAT